MSESTKDKDGHGHFVHEETDEVSESATSSPTTPTPNGTTTTTKQAAAATDATSSHYTLQNRPASSSTSKRAPKNGTANSKSRPKSAKVKKTANGGNPEVVHRKVNNDSQPQRATIHDTGLDIDPASTPRNIKPQSDTKDGLELIRHISTNHEETVPRAVKENNVAHDRSGRNASSKGHEAVSTPVVINDPESKRKISPVPKPRNKKAVEKPSRHCVTLPGSPFESGSNTECIQLLRQLWNVHEEAIQFLGQIRSGLTQFRQELRIQDNLFESSLREKRHSNATTTQSSNSLGGGALISSGGAAGNENSEIVVDGWIPLQTFIDGLKFISDSFFDIEKQFGTLSVFQAQCKLTLFAKVKHAKLQVTNDRLSIMHGIQQLITVALNLLASPSFWCVTEEGKAAKLVQNVFQLTEVHNSVLESSWFVSSEAKTEAMNSYTSSLTSMESPTSAVNNNASNKKVSNTSSVQVLVQINAANRNDSALLKLSIKPLSGTRLLQILAQKRSTFAAHSLSKTILSNLYANPTGVLTPEMFECCYSDEDCGLGPLVKGFSQTPSLLGHAVVKKTENGDQRLCRSTRTRLYSYFHQVLWTLAGEHAEDLLLWGPFSNVPLVLQPLDTLFSLRAAISLGKILQESNLSPMLSAFDSVSGALHSFSLLANWDEKMRDAFEETYKVKRPEHIALIAKPESSQWATEIGSKFGQIVTSCVTMIDSASSGNNINIRARGSQTFAVNEEEPLETEAQVFFRLEATLVYFKAWVVKRSKVWLNGWAIPQFLAISQREPVILVKLIKSRESLLITRDFLLNHEDISIRLSAKHRKACADDLRAAVLQVQSMPDELLLAVGPVCRTLSLATLQSYMPPANHWKGSGSGIGHGPDKPSNYVSVFIGRVIEPVTTASVELIPGTVQEAMGKQVVHAACDAWLQYILHKKLKFSEWGAVQLLRDFTAFREWIRTETELEKEARKSILQLEVLKTCEGVAYLLLRNPGDVLGVGKKQSRKNRRVAPSSDSLESSPGGAGTDSTAEDDIPAEMYVPNQQMWLELRLRRNYFTPPCC